MVLEEDFEKMKFSWTGKKKHLAKRKKLKKLDYIKIKKVCSVNYSIKRWKRQPKQWEKIFGLDIFKKRTHRYAANQ